MKEGAAGIFGVRTQNFRRDWVSRPDFPKPIVTLAATPVWQRDELVRYRTRVQPVAWPPRRRGLRLSPVAATWLPVIKRRLVRRFRPERIVLFGSQARGEGGPDSDLDLLVVVPEDSGDARAIAAEMRASLRGVPVAVDIVVTTPAQVGRHGSLVGTVLRPALREGSTIHARA